MAGPLRGRGDPFAVDVTIEAGTLETVGNADTTVVENLTAYDRDTGDLQYLSHHGPDGPVYGTKPFDRWARVTCTRVGTERLNDLLDTPFDDDMVDTVMTFEGDPSVAVFQTTTLFDRDGNVVSESTVDIDDLLDVTPRSLTTTVSIGDRSRTATFPVEVERSESHQL